MLEKYLIKKYDLPIDNIIITPCDIFNMYSNFTEYKNNLLNFTRDSLVSNYKLTEIEETIIYYDTHKYRYLYYLISQTYIDNYFHEVNFIISNTNNLSNSNDDYYFIRKFNRLYDQKNMILSMGEHIISIFEKLIKKEYNKSDKYDLIKFYNEKSIKKFIDSLKYDLPDLTKINNLIIREKIIDFYENYLMVSVKKISEYLNKHLLNGSFDSNKYNSNTNTDKKYGLSNFDPKLYMFFIEYQTGLKFNKTEEIDFLYKWAFEYLDYNIKKKIEVIKKIYNLSDSDIINLTNSTNQLAKQVETNISDLVIFKQLSKIINSDKKYSFATKEEFVDLYVKAVDNNSKLLIKYNLPYAYKCTVDVFNNKNFSTGYYSDNCFYLNVANWSNCKKYEIKSLSLHESYPGHHTQIDISHNFAKNKYLLTLYNQLFNAFAEGWALFAESLSDDISINEVDYLSDYFGILESDTLRIFRIIADIDLHYYGKTPEETIKKMENYCSFDDETISTEIYRYEVLPAQALCYKIGQNVFMKIYIKIKNSLKKDINIKINDYIMIETYKKILLNGEISLSKLLDKYNIKFFYQ